MVHDFFWKILKLSGSHNQSGGSPRDRQFPVFNLIAEGFTVFGLKNKWNL